jgi:hypothetical protein
MTDDYAEPTPEEPRPAPEPPPTPEPDPWRDVVEGFETLATAIGRWAKSVVDDPENRRRAQQLKERLGDVARDFGEAADRAADKMRTAAEKRERRSDEAEAQEATPPEGDRAE